MYMGVGVYGTIWAQCSGEGKGFEDRVEKS